MCWVWGFRRLVIIDQKGGGAEDQAGQFWVIEASRPRTCRCRCIQSACCRVIFLDLVGVSVDPKLISDILWSTHYSLITAYDYYQVLIVTLHALLLSCVPYCLILLLFIYIHRLFPLILFIFIAICSRKDFLQFTAPRCTSI